METKSVAVAIQNLHFEYKSGDARYKALDGLNMQLPIGARCLIVGSNGAGKSTLLRILAGKHMTSPDDAVQVMGKDAFRDITLNTCRAHLDTQWGMRTVAFSGYGCALQADIRVADMMKKLQETYPVRRDILVKLLGIDLNWRMHMVSDGQRRRVQLLLALVRPFDVLLLDEVTTCLDVIVRQDLLKWLLSESELHGSTIIYATHIFDGLDDWPTHVHYLTRNGTTGWQGCLDDLGLYHQLRRTGHVSPLLRVVVKWLRDEQRTQEHIEEEHGIVAHTQRHGVLTQSGYNPGRVHCIQY